LFFGKEFVMISFLKMFVSFKFAIDWNKIIVSLVWFCFELWFKKKSFKFSLVKCSFVEFSLKKVSFKTKLLE
jgi:hypothetical protein